VGAFVEPDEKRLVSKSKEIQTHVVVAGSTANLITAIVFFILLFGFLFVTSPFRGTGWMVMDGMENDTVIYSVNGVELDGYQQFSFEPGEIITMETNHGTIYQAANEEGLIGIHYVPLSSPPYTQYDFPVFGFIFRSSCTYFLPEFHHWNCKHASASILRWIPLNRIKY